MIRTIKALGLVLAAALCVSATAASAAQAETQFTAGLTPNTHTKSILHGTQEGNSEENYFEVGSERWGCASAAVTYKATGDEANGAGTSKTVTTQTGEEYYKDCEAEGLPVTVTMNGCHYRFNQPTKLAENEYTGTVDLTCPEGVEGVVIHVFLFGTPTGSHSVPVCTIKVTPGSNTEHVVTHNRTHENEKDDVTIETTIENKIPYHKSGTCGEATGNLSVFGKITVKGEDEEGEPHDVWISGE